MRPKATAILVLCLVASVRTDEVEDRIRELRIEMVKYQILSKLNLKEPPQTEASPSDQAVRLLLQDTEDAPPATYHERERLVIPAIGDGAPCPQTNSSRCRIFRYELGSALNASSIDLWVYKLSDVPGGLSVTWSIFGDETDESFYFQVGDRGWTKFRLLSSLLLSASWNDTVECSVEIIGRDTEDRGARRPYLMASKPPVETIPRHRRDADCDTNENCCKKPLRLSFAEIGFNFIVYPQALEANMCVGKCRLDHGTLHTHYERALTTAIEKNSTLAETLGECWTLCCKPKQLNEVRVIYKDMENLHHDQLIPELSVESCSCS